MSVFDVLERIVPRRLTDGVVTRVIDGERMTLVYVELEPGSVVAEHRHDNEQIGILVAGSIDFRVGAERRVQRAGETWAIPPGVPHGIEETGPDGAALIEAFTPNRPDYADLPRLALCVPRMFPSKETTRS